MALLSAAAVIHSGKDNNNISTFTFTYFSSRLPALFGLAVCIR